VIASPDTIIESGDKLIGFTPISEQGKVEQEMRH
jgi:hypothetical protein